MHLLFQILIFTFCLSFITTIIVIARVYHVKKQTKMTNTERHEECLQTLAAINLEAQQGKPLSAELIEHIKNVLKTCKIEKIYY